MPIKTEVSSVTRRLQDLEAQMAYLAADLHHLRHQSIRQSIDHWRTLLRDIVSTTVENEHETGDKLP